MQKHIVAFSGGKDSTAMLLKLLDSNARVDDIVFCDTGLEFPEMYEHIKKVERFIDRKITILQSKYDFEYYMLYKKKGSRQKVKEDGYGYPTSQFRWCTWRLKQDPKNEYLAKSYIKKHRRFEYVGIAADEISRRRVGFDSGEGFKIYPLIEWGMTEKDCLKYCYDLGFDWGGLYEKFHRVSCWCCPLQPLKSLRVLYNDFPELWAQLKDWDSKSWRQFRSDYSVEELENKFNCEQNGGKWLKAKKVCVMPQLKLPFIKE